LIDSAGVRIARIVGVEGDRTAGIAGTTWIAWSTWINRISGVGAGGAEAKPYADGCEAAAAISTDTGVEALGPPSDAVVLE
jgi:hypothetical protein